MFRSYLWEAKTSHRRSDSLSPHTSQSSVVENTNKCSSIPFPLVLSSHPVNKGVLERTELPLAELHYWLDVAVQNVRAASTAAVCQWSELCSVRIKQLSICLFVFLALVSPSALFPGTRVSQTRRILRRQTRRCLMDNHCAITTAAANYLQIPVWGKYQLNQNGDTRLNSYLRHLIISVSSVND